LRREPSTRGRHFEQRDHVNEILQIVDAFREQRLPVVVSTDTVQRFCAGKALIESAGTLFEAGSDISQRTGAPINTRRQFGINARQQLLIRHKHTPAIGIAPISSDPKREYWITRRGQSSVPN
jgi:hypothetical protein